MKKLILFIALIMLVATVGPSCSKKPSEEPKTKAESPLEDLKALDNPDESATGVAALGNEEDMETATGSAALNASGTASLPATASTPGGAKGTIWCDQNSKTNVREQPNTTAPVVDAVWANNSVTVFETANGWAKVRTPNGKEGWMFGAFLDSQANGACKLALAAADGAKVKTSLTDGKDAGIPLSKNQRLCIVGTQGARNKAVFPDGKTGWIESQYLQKK
jgi:uncharacterized protein YgiM (DUF1202 family)